MRAILSLRVLVLVLLAAAGAAGGCTTAVEAGRNTALDSVDLVAMTDDMAAKIVADPEVQRAVQGEGSLVVVVQPVVNEMTAEVLPAGPAHAFTARVRTLLSRRAPPDWFTWVMNKEAYYRLRDQELEGVDLGSSPERIQPRYALVARFRSLTDESRRGRRSYYLCVYQLTDLREGDILWADKYEVEKAAVKGFLD